MSYSFTLKIIEEVRREFGEFGKIARGWKTVLKNNMESATLCGGIWPLSRTFLTSHD